MKEEMSSNVLSLVGYWKQNKIDEFGVELKKLRDFLEAETTLIKLDTVCLSSLRDEFLLISFDEIASKINSSDAVLLVEVIRKVMEITASSWLDLLQKDSANMIIATQLLDCVYGSEHLALVKCNMLAVVGYCCLSSFECRDYFFSRGCESITELLKASDNHQFSILCDCISNILYCPSNNNKDGENIHHFQCQFVHVIPILVRRIANGYQDELNSVILSLWNIVYDNRECSQTLLSEYPNIVDHLLKYVNHESESVRGCSLLLLCWIGEAELSELPDYVNVEYIEMGDAIDGIKVNHFDSDLVSKGMNTIANIICNHPEMGYVFVNSKRGAFVSFLVQYLENLDEIILSSVTLELYRIICASPYARETFLYYGSRMNRSPVLCHSNIGLFDNGLHDYQVDINIITLKLLNILAQENSGQCFKLVGLKNIKYIINNYLNTDQELSYDRVRETLNFLACITVNNDTVVSHLREDVHIIQRISDILLHLPISRVELYRPIFSLLESCLDQRKESNHSCSTLFDRMLSILEQSSHSGERKEIIQFLSAITHGKKDNQDYFSSNSDIVRDIEKSLQCPNERLYSLELIYSLTYDHDINKNIYLTEAIVSTMLNIIQTRSNDCTIDTVILSCLSNNPNNQLKDLIARLGGMQVLCSLLNDIETQEATILCVRSIISHHEELSHQFIQSNGVESLMKMIQTTSKQIHPDINDSEEDLESDSYDSEDENSISHKAFSTLVCVHGSLALERVIQLLEEKHSCLEQMDREELKTYLPVLNGLVYMTSEYSIDVMWRVHKIVHNITQAQLEGLSSNCHVLPELRDEEEVIPHAIFILCNLTSLSGNDKVFKQYQNRIASSNTDKVMGRLLKVATLAQTHYCDMELESMVYTILHNMCFNCETNKISLLNHHDGCLLLQRLSQIIATTPRNNSDDDDMSQMNDSDGEYEKEQHDELWERCVELFVMLNEECECHETCERMMGEKECTQLLQYLTQQHVDTEREVKPIFIAKCQQILGQNLLA